jgi:ABC-type sugar transport system ATPase subunit
VQSLLEATGITKAFSGQQALSDVSVSFAAGEGHAVAGENGAGKSTLMAVLAGILRPDAGEVRLDGEVLPLGSIVEAQRRGIGLVPQEPQGAPTLSVAENISLGETPSVLSLLRVIDRKRLSEVAAAALKLVGVDVPLEAPFGRLRLADRQLVLIARALHRGSRILILDEPTSSLSTREVERLYEVVARMKSSGRAVVAISHRLEELRAMTERITVLRDGVNVLTASLAEVTNAEVVRAMAGHEVTSAGALRAAPSEDVVLDVAGLCSKRVASVSFQVRRGEIVGLAGLLGAGRSRTLHSIFGSEKRSAGTVRLSSGHGPVDIRTVSDSLSSGMGLVPEDRRAQGLVLDQSLETNVTLVLPRAGQRFGFLSRGVLLQTALDAIRDLAIKASGVRAKVATLSGGNQQKVVLARFMRPETKVLLLDEPTRGVDVGAKEEIHRHLESMAARGLGLVMASSEIPELLRLCHRILIFREGRIVGEVSSAEATAERIVALAAGVAA